MKIKPYEYQYEEEALAEHARLSKLFKENRFMFELERKKAIENTINSTGHEALKKELEKLQREWDSILRSSGSPQNRLVMIQMLLWDFVHNRWLPALRK
ncbi:MAG: DUF3135 domain-containing protein [Desulfobacter sp.]